MAIPKSRIQNLKFLFLLLLAGCRGLDDDANFYPETRATFLLCPDTTGIGNTIVKITDSLVDPVYNRYWGISNANLNDMRGSGNTLWISSAADDKIQKINLRTETVSETYSSPGLFPHFICPGEKYLLISDSSSNRIGFLKIKTGEIVLLNLDGQPGNAIYNNGKFYLDIGGEINIYNEAALTAYSKIPSAGKIIDIHLDAYKNVQVHFTDSSTSNFVFTIDGNGDLQSGTFYPVNWTEGRYTPFYYSQFESEILQNAFLINQQVNLGSSILPDSANAFECDFFEGRIFSTWGDSLTIRSLPGMELESRQWFPYQPASAFFYIDEQGN